MILARMIFRFIIVSTTLLAAGKVHAAPQHDVLFEEEHLWSDGTTTTKEKFQQTSTNLPEFSTAEGSSATASEVFQRRKVQSSDGGSEHFFQFRVLLQTAIGDNDLCGDAERALIDSDINQLLLQYQVGDLGNTTDQGDFLSGPCTPPDTAAPTRTPSASPVPTPTPASAVPSAPIPMDFPIGFTPNRKFGYIWSGLGGCRFCGFDDGVDGRRRRMQLGLTPRAEALAELLTDELENNIAPNHIICLGVNPAAIVQVREVSKPDADLFCGRPLEEIQSLSSMPTTVPISMPTTVPISMPTSIIIVDDEITLPPPPTCAPSPKIDFAKKGDGNDLFKGEYLFKNSYWKTNKIGVRVFASPGNTTCREKGRIVDTSNSREYPQLGSPNAECNPSDGLVVDPAGIGDGGKPGQAGGNCEPLGTCLHWLLVLSIAQGVSETEHHFPNASIKEHEPPALALLVPELYVRRVGYGVNVDDTTAPLSPSVERKAQAADDAHFFEIRIHLEAQVWNEEQCSGPEKTFIDNGINQLLREHGLGDLGNTTDPTVLSGPCPLPEAPALTNTPTDSTHSALMPPPATTNPPPVPPIPSAPTLPWDDPTPADYIGASIPLKVFGYLWGGVGGCNYCGPDKKDARRRKQSGVTAMAESLSTLLTEALTEKIASKHLSCLGLDPIVVVKAKEVTSADVDASCGREWEASTLDAAGMQSNPILANDDNNASCGPCTKLDFSKKIDGTDFVKGDLLRKNEYWQTKFGVKIFGSPSRNGATRREKGRIFDTSNPGNTSYIRYPRLGSPNVKCDPNSLGTGIGGGGQPGQAGENCEPVGNVLIIQDVKYSYPRPSDTGSTFTFKFREPVVVSEIGMMNIAEKGKHRLIFVLQGRDKNARNVITFNGLGANSVQRITTNKPNVRKMKVRLSRPGAIT